MMRYTAYNILLILDQSLTFYYTTSSYLYSKTRLTRLICMSSRHGLILGLIFNHMNSKPILSLYRVKLGLFIGFFVKKPTKIE